MLSSLRGLLPDTAPVSPKERIRAGATALIGILLTGLIGSAAASYLPGFPALVAPMGASAVLLFAVPSSPLAQPWSILGGNVLAALVGVTAAAFIPHLYLAAAAAAGIAIALMMTFRCLHPPSGAIALTAVLGGPAIHDLGYGFVLWPVFGNSLLLLGTALALNKLSGRTYPHRVRATPAQHGTQDPAPIQRIGFTSADLDEVLEDYDEFLDINRDDLETILRRTELKSYRRRASHTDCASIMSRDVVAVAPDTTLREAHDLMRRHHFHALPVTNDRAEVVGIITHSDFLNKPTWTGGRPRIGFMQRLHLALSGASAPNDTVKDIMTYPVKTVQPETPIADAIILFAEQGVHDLPVVRDNSKLAGIISQSDALVAMLADKAA